MSVEILPASAAQQRLWFMAEMRPGDPFYNVPFEVRFDGPLDPAALRRALTELARRQPALRTGLRAVDGHVEQVVAAPGPVQVATGQDDDVAAFLDRGFDLAAEPLARFLLVRVSETEHRLVGCVHHVVFDGVSLDLFRTELISLYATYAAGAEPAPREPADYAGYSRRRAAAAGDGAAAFWTKHLTGAPEVMDLPLDRSRPAVTRHRMAYLSRTIAPAVADRLAGVARRFRASEYMLTKAACDVLLRQHGVTDVVTALALAGRDDPATAELIGYLARPVVVRTEFGDDPSFGDLLGRVRGSLLDAMEQPDLPFETVLGALGVAHDPSYYPFYQVMFGYEEVPAPASAGELTVRVSYPLLPTAKVELDFALTRTEQGLRFRIGYREDLFDAVTVQRMLERLETILGRIVEDPAQPVSDLIAATDADVRLVLHDWNDTTGEVPDLLIHQLLERQAAVTPDAVAARSGDRRWSYRELDAAANRAGHLLLDLGVVPEARVGVCLPRSLEMLAVMLGIFKAGGVWVPLDPALPQRRLDQIVADAGLAVIVAAPRYAERVAGYPARHVELTEDDPRLRTGPDGPVDSPVRPANAAYILFTSGSTGGPKGVVLEHRNLINIITWAHRELGPETFTSVPLISSMTFDVCMWEIFTALAGGGTVVIAEDALALPRTPGTDTLSLVTAVPSIWSELLKMGGPPGSPPTVVSNGEVLAPSVLRGLAELPGVERIYNMYAPTETTTFSLFNIVRPGEAIPIGRPMLNTKAYILDPRKRPVPPGVVGELHLGGAGVTRGYLNRPALTAERFIPDPFSTTGGERLYATGDLVRYASDGRILYVGRVDHQVKLRGARIELGEVEAIILTHPAVGEACAMVRRAASGDELVAAAAPRPGAAVSDAELRGFLADRLPAYMVPAVLRVTDSLPLLPSGKLDRKAVLALLAAGSADRPKEATVGEAEERVAACWAEVLGGAAGATDNFFDAGGNSLLIIRLREALRAAFGRDVHVIDLFRHPTIRAMATFLTGAAAPESVSTGSERGSARRTAQLSAARRSRTTT
ncbi:non-ribosomal peptide synthetase [Micromonospora sp. DT231]|uniref:non-ribosomal peptide synthetase n=1 Tax=Micromonospora sp. DT231 TaxID=3416526 RepID=UPI003CE9DECA